ncbi:hypothetical protein [Rhizobium leguminosarum]|uniref:hypothetical protein n=1 Tax=Rhizobium leguminosarum TaxID=384 RepID=UPI000B92B2C0|nr:hypothetical protein [Rhizobium leguminosarum]ASS55867.1 hypothetical protein CHR56_15565 [Rhizobium leguminosarum bv. viciae]
MTIETELPAVKVKSAVPERIWLYRPFRELSSELCGPSDIWYAEEDLGDHDIQDGVKYEYVLKDDPGSGGEAEPEAWVVRCKGWGEELCFTEDGAKELASKLENIVGNKKSSITPLYARPTAIPQKEG